MAITPSTIKQESAGNLKLILATFTDIDNGETWASGITEIVKYHATGTDDPTTQGNESIDVALSGSTFTFYTGEDNRTGTLFVYCNG